MTILIKLVFLFKCVLAVPGTLAWALPEFGCILSSSLLHSSMLSGLLRTPLQFFDVTPSGRVISRFSKDVDTTDTLLPWLIPEFVYFFFEVISTTISWHYIVFAPAYVDDTGEHFFHSHFIFTGKASCLHFQINWFFILSIKGCSA